MVTAVLLAFLLGQAPQAGQQPSLPPEALGAPPLVNEAPTAYACTVDTLREGRECIFEAERASSAPGGDQASSNVSTVRQAAPALCAEAAKPPSGGATDRALAALCERMLAPATDACSLNGSAAVIDAKGRFAPEARTCYRGLSRVLQDVTMMATVSSGCCQCAAQRGCAGATGDRCYTELTRQQAAPATLACLSDKCADACALALPSAQGASPERGPRTQNKPGHGAAATP